MTPKTNKECYALLDDMLSEDDKKAIIEKGIYELHFTLGMWIRNNWIYPQSAEDVENMPKTFNKVPRFSHPDDCSSIILEAYRKNLMRKEMQKQK